MWQALRNNRRTLEQFTSDMLERIQRLERQYLDLRAKIEGERQLRILAAQIVGAAQATPIIGESIEPFAQAMRAPSLRGRAGGLARARTAWRYFDGTFMPESAKLEARIADYDRYAAGGRARAERAGRGPDGRFLSDVRAGS